MSAVDLENEFAQLWRLLVKIKYTIPTSEENAQPIEPTPNELPKDVFRSKLIKGDTAALLPIIHHSLLIYSKRLKNYLLNKDYKIYGQSDTRFTDEVYRLLRNEFNNNPILQPSQFLTIEGYAKSKLQFVSKMIKFAIKKDLELKKIEQQSEIAKKPWKETNLSKKVEKNIAKQKETQLQKKMTETKRKEKENSIKQAKLAAIKSKKHLKTKQQRRSQPNSIVSELNANSDNSDKHSKTQRKPSNTATMVTTEKDPKIREIVRKDGLLSNQIGSNKTNNTNNIMGDGSSYCDIRSELPIPISFSKNNGDSNSNSNSSNNGTNNEEDCSSSPRLHTTMIENEEKASELSDSEVLLPLKKRLELSINARNKAMKTLQTQTTQKIDKNTANNGQKTDSNQSKVPALDGINDDSKQTAESENVIANNNNNNINDNSSKPRRITVNPNKTQDSTQATTKQTDTDTKNTNKHKDSGATTATDEKTENNIDINDILLNYDPIAYEQLQNATLESLNPKFANLYPHNDAATAADSQTFFKEMLNFSNDNHNVGNNAIVATMTTINENEDNMNSESKINDRSNIIAGGGGASGSNMGNIDTGAPAAKQATHSNNDKNDRNGENKGNGGDSPHVTGIEPSQNKYNELLMQSSHLVDINDGTHDALFSAFDNINDNYINNNYHPYGRTNNITNLTNFDNLDKSGKELKEDLDTFDIDNFNDDLTIYGSKIHTPLVTSSRTGLTTLGGAIDTDRNRNSRRTGLGGTSFDGLFGTSSLSNNNNNNNNIGNNISNNRFDRIDSFDTNLHTGGGIGGSSMLDKKTFGISDTYMTSESTQLMLATVLSKMDNFEKMFKDYAERTDAKLTIMKGKIDFLENKVALQEKTPQQQSTIDIPKPTQIKPTKPAKPSTKPIKVTKLTNNGKERESTVGSPPVTSSLTPADGDTSSSNNQIKNKPKISGISGISGIDGIDGIDTIGGIGGISGSKSTFINDGGSTVNSTFVGRYSGLTTGETSSSSKRRNILNNNINFLNSLGPPKSPILHKNSNESNNNNNSNIGNQTTRHTSGIVSNYQSFDRTQTTPLHFMQWPTSNSNSRGSENYGIYSGVGNNGNNINKTGRVGKDKNLKVDSSLQSQPPTDESTLKFLDSIKKTIAESTEMLNKSSSDPF